jgi:uncharacterized membrane protein
VATVFGAMLLALTCIGLLLFFIHHIAHAISVSHIVDRIASETERMIDEMMPSPHRDIRMEAPDLSEVNTWDTPLLGDESGYIRFVDIQRLVALAKFSHVKVHVVRRVGQFVPAGTPLLMIYRGSRLTPEASTEFRNVVDLGPSRTLQQDIEFGILQIVDIALKAISPAVNDPSTAITCVDHLSRILIRFASREPAPHLFYDPPGILRVNINWTDLDHLLDSAFEQIRMYAKGDIAVSLRLLRALGDVAMTTPDTAIRKALHERGKRIVEGCAEKLRGEDLRSLRARLAALEKLAVAPSGVAEAQDEKSRPEET